MNYLQKQADRALRCAIVATWDKRLALMKEKTGMDIKAFCDSCSPPVDDTHINHIKAGRRGARWDLIKSVEKRLVKLGIPLPKNLMGKTSV